MTVQDIQEMKDSIRSMRNTVRWLVGAVYVLAAIHGPEILRLVMGQ